MAYSEYYTMREIGKLIGSNSHQVGRALKRLGLRLENGEPSALAFQLGLVQKRQVFNRPGHDVWTWNMTKTLPFLEGAKSTGG